MKVMPLFSQEDDAPNKGWVRYLDLPDDHPEKRAFLNECVLEPVKMQAWEQMLRLVDAGKSLPADKPSPLIRAQILQQAHAELRRETVRETAPAKEGAVWDLPGWRWAWAALFLVVSGGVYLQMETSYTSSARFEQVDNELISLEQELDFLNADIDLEKSTS